MEIDEENVFKIVISSSENHIAREDVNLQSTFQDELSFDSISFLTLALYLAEEFGLDISQDNDAYYRVKTIGDLVDFLKSK